MKYFGCFLLFSLHWVHVIQNYELTYYLIEKMGRLNERMVFNSFGYSLKYFSMNYYKTVPSATSTM